MRRIIKALILGWIGKKIYDRVSADDEPEKEATEAKRSPAKRTTGKATRRAKAA